MAQNIYVWLTTSLIENFSSHTIEYYNILEMYVIIVIIVILSCIIVISEFPLLHSPTYNSNCLFLTRQMTCYIVDMQYRKHFKEDWL